MTALMPVVALVTLSVPAAAAAEGERNGEEHGVQASPQSPPVTPAVTSRVSIGPDGREGTNESFDSAVSADGRFVAFSSEAADLVPDDSNESFDVLVRDRRWGVTTRVSLGPGGRQADGHSSDPAVSADGRYIAFVSTASDLVPGDTNGSTDVFVRDRLRRLTTRVSVGPGGRQTHPAQPPVISVADTAISADGRHVAFTSTAADLVPGDTNATPDVFVHDRRTGLTRRVSVGPGGRQSAGPGLSPAISGNGRYVAFTSTAADLVPGDTNATPDVFVHDRRTGLTRRVSVGPGGRQSAGPSLSPAISGDGRHVAFTSTADNLVPRDTNGGADVFVRDRVRGITTRVSLGPNGRQVTPGSALPGDGQFRSTAVSADGRYVAFTSTAADLVRADTNQAADVFVHDRTTKRTRRVSLGAGGRQGNEDSLFPDLSADGRVVSFSSEASTLVRDDSNETSDVFVHAPLTSRGSGT